MLAVVRSIPAMTIVGAGLSFPLVHLDVLRVDDSYYHVSATQTSDSVVASPTVLRMEESYTGEIEQLAVDFSAGVVLEVSPEMARLLDEAVEVANRAAPGDDQWAVQLVASAFLH